jgi:hypothetical protein
MSDGDGPAWRSNRERITYEEGRHVLEAQRADIDDIDDKALRTVRITALLLGVGVTGVRVTGTGHINKVVASASLFSFLVSLLFGIFVYNESDEVIGPTANYLGRLRRNDTSAQWEADLLVQFENWIDENRKIVDFNGRLLVTCQFFFILGISFGTAALLALEMVEVLLLSTVLFLMVVVTLIVIKSKVRGG